MKLKKYVLLVALSAILGFYGCDNNDDESISVTPEVQAAFSSKYPNVKNVEWEIKSGYYVADFHNGYESSAWFTADGKWHMTETDIPYDALPDPVKSSFEVSEYASWRKDDVDKLERDGIETVYVIEVEKQNQEVDLYYSTEGVLIKSIVDVDNDNDDHLPPTQQITAAMEKFINEKYAGARIVEVDIEDDKNNGNFGFTEIDIIHEGISKEVLFDKNGSWHSTSWDVQILPTVIMNTISTQYPDYRIDDAEYYEKPDGIFYYLLELESNNLPDKDKQVRITANGEVLS